MSNDLFEALHPSIKKLAFDMQYKLDKNSHKNTGWVKDGVARSEQGWLLPDCPLSFLVKKLHEEIGELLELCVSDEVDKFDVRMEAADVANLAMMIRDNLLVEIK